MILQGDLWHMIGFLRSSSQIILLKMYVILGLHCHKWIMNTRIGLLVLSISCLLDKMLSAFLIYSLCSNWCGRIWFGIKLNKEIKPFGTCAFKPAIFVVVLSDLQNNWSHGPLLTLFLQYLKFFNLIFPSILL